MVDNRSKTSQKISSTIVIKSKSQIEKQYSILILENHFHINSFLHDLTLDTLFFVFV